MIDQTAIVWLTMDSTGVLVQLFFCFTIMLMIFDKQKPPTVSSVMTGIALIVLGVGDSFNAEAVSVVTTINGILWLFLGWQRYRQQASPVSADTVSRG